MKLDPSKFIKLGHKLMGKPTTHTRPKLLKLKPINSDTLITALNKETECVKEEFWWYLEKFNLQLITLEPHHCQTVGINIFFSVTPTRKFTKG